MGRRVALEEALSKTQRKYVAEMLGVSNSTLSKYISGEIDPPTSKALQLSVILKRSIPELFPDLLHAAKPLRRRAG